MRAGLQNLSDIVGVRRLRLSGHILRLAAARPANVAMNWMLDNGSRRKNRPRRLGA